MMDVTAGRSAGTPANAELDPTRPQRPALRRRPGRPIDVDRAIEALRDLTAGRSAGSVFNVEQDPTRARPALRDGLV